MNTIVRLTLIIVWAVAAACTIYGIVTGLSVLNASSSAIQEIDSFCYILTFAIVPYVLARAVTSMIKIGA